MEARMSTQEAPAEPVVEAPAAPEVEGAKPDEPLGEAGIAALKSEREARKQAEKAAADALAKVKEFEDRDKSESEKQQEALEEAKRELAELTVAKTRAEVAATKQVPAELIAGPASGSAEDLAAFADALIAFKGDPQPQKLYVPNISKSPGATKTTAELFTEAVQDAI